MPDPQQFDLGAYLSRIGYSGPLKPNLVLLEALHAAHATTIPFENLDVVLGRRISLDIGSLQEKLVRSRRGGYCFEHNTLFAAALGGLGFQVSTLEARVRPPGATAIRPRTHMFLRVDLDGRSWLVDVGFGGDGPFHPVPLDGSVSQQPCGAYRVMSEGSGGLALQLRRGSIWSDLYAFTLVPAHPIDYEVANHYTSTHPQSGFVRVLTAQIRTHDEQHTLRGRTYIVRREDDENTLELEDRAIVQLLHDQFGLLLPEKDIVQAISKTEGTRRRLNRKHVRM